MRTVSSPRSWLGVLVAFAFVSARAAAEVEMPRRSPRAKVSQQVGLTEIVVEYDSPAVRGRPIWGAVVPYDEVWRRGEIPAPKITFNRSVAFGDRVVPAGTYALLMIPSRSDWTVVLNRRPNLLETERGFRPDLDVARFRVRSVPAPFRERLTFLFSNFTNDGASLDLEWERVRVSIPIRVFTAEQIAADIRALDSVGRQYADAARYMLETKKDYAAGLTYVDRSLALGENWYNVWIKASLLAARGEYPEAREQADRAYELGAKSGGEFFLESDVRNALQSWPRPSEKRIAAAAPSKRRAGISTSPPPATDPPAPPLIAIVTERPAEVHASAQPVAAAPAGELAPPTSTLSERKVSVHQPAPAALAKAATSADVAPIIKKGKTDLQWCYQRALRKDPTLTRGRITISLTVGVSGHASSVALDAPDRLGALEPCIKEVVSHWAFPASSGEYGIEFPLVLSGRE